MQEIGRSAPALTPRREGAKFRGTALAVLLAIVCIPVGATRAAEPDSTRVARASFLAAVDDQILANDRVLAAVARPDGLESDAPRLGAHLRMPGPEAPGVRRLALAGLYGGLYSSAAKIGSRLGLERDFRVARLESAWVIDVFGHVYLVRHASNLFASIHRWAGDDERTARRRGAWYAGFGSLLYMETINGFMPGVRFDWMDPISNAGGAWLADGGPDFADRHPWSRRLSLELGYKDWHRLTQPDDDTGAFTRVWHDYPNMRFGVGYGVGPLEREWARVFLSYGVTSLHLADLRNQFGLGIELKPHHWIAPWIERVPGGGALLSLAGAIDRSLLLPGLYFQLFDLETGPFTQREPFDE